MKTIHAIYENGVFRPTERVDLPENTPVEIELPLIAEHESACPSRSLSRHAGVIKSLPVDPVQFQRRIREEWD